MPNWCSTNISINCKNKEEAKILYAKIEEWTSYDYCENGFGHDWLGNIVGNSGIDSRKDGKDFSVRCRGELTFLDLNEEQVIIATETAWSPMLQMWKKICDKYLTEYEIIYTAEECGCELFFTNDPILLGKYIVDSLNDDFTNEFLNGESYDRETTKEYLRNVLQNCLVISEKDINTLLKMFHESDYEDVYIHPWEYVPISELD